MHCVFPTESPAYLPVSGNVDVEAGERGVDEPLEGLQNLAVGVLLIELLHLTQKKSDHIIHTLLAETLYLTKHITSLSSQKPLT